MRTHKKKIGTRPFSGTRFVEDGLVRYEWWPDGRRRARTVGPVNRKNLKRADDILTAGLEAARQRAAGVESVPIAAVLTVGDLFRRYNVEAAVKVSDRTGAKLRPATLRSYGEYETLIVAFFEPEVPMAAAAMTRRKVRDFIRRLQESGKGGGMVRRIIEHLRQVYRWAVSEAEILDADPISGVRSPKHKAKPAPYTREEARMLYEALIRREPNTRGRQRNDWRFRLVALLTCVYGVRVSQATGLRWGDVDMDRAVQIGEAMFDGTVTWRKERTGSKGQEDRTVPLLPAVRDALVAAWNLRQGELVAWGWQNPTEPVTYDAMQRGLHALERRAGVATIAHRAFHSFRRAMMTVLVEELGVNQAAALTGDTPVVIMRDYVRPTKEAMAQAVAKVVEIFPGPRANRASSDESGQGSEATA